MKELKMKELKERLARLSFAYMVCPKEDKKIILKEMLKIKNKLQ